MKMGLLREKRGMGEGASIGRKEGFVLDKKKEIDWLEREEERNQEWKLRDAWISGRGLCYLNFSLQK